MSGSVKRKCCCGGTDGNCTCSFSACPNTDVDLECSRCCDQNHVGTVVNRTPNAYHVVVTGVQICPDQTYSISCGIVNFSVRLNQSTFSGSFNVAPTSACGYQFVGDAIDYMTLDQSDGAGGHIAFTDRRLKIVVNYNIITAGPSTNLSISLTILPCGISHNGVGISIFNMANSSCCNVPNDSTSNFCSTCSCALTGGGWGYLGSATVEECAA